MEDGVKVSKALKGSGQEIGLERLVPDFKGVFILSLGQWEALKVLNSR